MIRVRNQKAIRRLSSRSLRANRARNIIAMAAIALTTLLFTALFTIALSVNQSFQESNFRQAGGYSHGTFKYLTQEQYDTLKSSPLISQYGLRRFLGVAQSAPFEKESVEVGFSDKNQAQWMYCTPVEGRLPQEGTDEAATDTHVLELLGIEPQLGAQFTVTITVDGTEVTKTFTLCGWWEYDKAIPAHHILIPESTVDTVLDDLGIIRPSSDNTGSWGMDVMFRSSLQIEQNMADVLFQQNYQNEDASAENYIATGVNWGYTGSQVSSNVDGFTVAAIATLLLLITFTGYLIIYNVFQISVAGDIRFYGLLKTIGTTPRQLRHMIRRQALVLSCIGIPAGLALGWVAGNLLAPTILARLDTAAKVVSVNPLIFLAAAVFSLVTVLLSCSKPGRMAAQVSPIEALRYTEGSNTGRKTKRSGGVSLPSMAWANLGQSKSKTIVTVLSLSLAVLLLTLTVTFSNGFDMDKYIANFVASDFVLADNDYFHSGRSVDPLSEAAVDAAASQDGISEGGCVYGLAGVIWEGVTEEYYRSFYGQWNTGDIIDQLVENAVRTDDGALTMDVALYGMEDFILDKLTVVNGDLSALYEAGSNAIAAVYTDDDYGNVNSDSHWAKLGDTVTLRYVDEYEYVNPETGAPVDPESGNAYILQATKYHDVTYTIAAEVIVPSALSYRYSGIDRYVLNTQTFFRDTGTDNVLLYACNMQDDAADAAMESFMADYTENQDNTLDYESKQLYADEFASFRSMFILLGSALSFIVGVVGVLNFFNAILTGIITRRREFAMLQSIGMTGRQLKTMLVCEGLYYALGAVLFSLLLTLAAGPLLKRVMERVFWFFSYHLTVTPIFLLAPVFLALGCLLPLLSYRATSKQTIVERLHQSD